MESTLKNKIKTIPNSKKKIITISFVWWEYLESALLAAFKCITVNTVTHIHTYNSTANYGHHTVH